MRFGYRLLYLFYFITLYLFWNATAGNSSASTDNDLISKLKLPFELPTPKGLSIINGAGNVNVSINIVIGNADSQSKDNVNNGMVKQKFLEKI